ncbi:hypothetical protein B0H14DRAFT_3450405 [Mycena olivaceomarginata]|nr:hypothetical protein B0H14DRAFT_3450405 [Mycena olivaceomarginata]
MPHFFFRYQLALTWRDLAIITAHLRGWIWQSSSQISGLGVFDSAFTSPGRGTAAHDAYDSDTSEAMSADAYNTTPTPQPARAASTASVVEITMDELPRYPSG